MVGTYRQHLAWVAAQLNGVKRHRSMKPSSRDPHLGLASPLNYAANKSGKIKIKSPSKKEAGAGCKSPALASREGTGETFFLDILFHRMSEIGCFGSYQSELQTPTVSPMRVGRLRRLIKTYVSTGKDLEGCWMRKIVPKLAKLREWCPV